MAKEEGHGRSELQEILRLFRPRGEKHRTLCPLNLSREDCVSKCVGWLSCPARRSLELCGLLIGPCARGPVVTPWADIGSCASGGKKEGGQGALRSGLSSLVIPINVPSPALSYERLGEAKNSAFMALWRGAARFSAARFSAARFSAARFNVAWRGAGGAVLRGVVRFSAVQFTRI
jgi:hypothetical protein